MADLQEVNPANPANASDLLSAPVRNNFAGLIEANIQKISGIDGGFLRGFQIERVTATTLSVAPGVAHISTTAGEDLQKKTTSTTINFATTGVNALDTGTVAPDTWYYIYIIRETATGNLGFLASTLTSAPTNPAGWVAKRLIDAWWRGDAVTGLKPGYTIGRERDRVRVWAGRFDDTSQDSLFQLEGGTATTETTVDLSALGGIPPANVTDALLIYPTRASIRIAKSVSGNEQVLTLRNNETGVAQDRVAVYMEKNKFPVEERTVLLIDKNIKYQLDVSNATYFGVSAYPFHA